MGEPGDANLKGTGRYLNATELRAWTRVLDASRRLEVVLARHLSDEHNMSHIEYEILVRLDGAGGSMRLATLAEQCVTSKSRLTHTVSRVEERGWIRRESVAEDGRGVAAVLTRLGSETLASASAGHAALIRQFLLQPLSASEVTALGNMMDRVATGLRPEGNC